MMIGPPSDARPVLPPHMLSPAPPQYAGLAQVPPLAVTPPQASLACPQLMPRSVHDFGVHAGAPSAVLVRSPPHLEGPPPPQYSGAVHVPQFAVRPLQPSLCWPQVPG